MMIVRNVRIKGFAVRKWRNIKEGNSKVIPMPGVDVPKGLSQSGMWDARDRKNKKC